MNKGIWAEKTLLALLIVFLPVQLGKHFWPVEAYVRGMRVDYLSPTVFATDIVVVLLLLVGALNAGRRMRVSHGIAAPALIVIALANVIFALSPATALYAWMRLAELVALFVYVRFTQTNVLERLRRLLPIPVLYSSMIALAQFVKEGSVGGLLYWLGERSFTIITPGIATAEWFGRVTLRPYATFSHPNALAGFLLAALAVILAKNKESKFSRSWADTIAVIAIIMGGFTLLLSRSLSAWFALALMVPVWAMRTFGKKSSSLIAVSVLAFLLATALFPPEAQSIEQRMSSLESVAVMIKTHPFVGVGLGNFTKALNLAAEGAYASSPFLYFQPAHNIFLLAASELGLPFLIVFAWFLISSLNRAGRKRRVGILLALIGILTTGLFDHYWLTLHQNRLIATVILALAWSRRQD